MQADRITAKSPGSEVFLVGGKPLKPKAKTSQPALPFQRESPTSTRFPDMRPKSPLFDIRPSGPAKFSEWAEEKSAPIGGTLRTSQLGLDKKPMVLNALADHRAFDKMETPVSRRDGLPALKPTVATPTLSWQLLADATGDKTGEPEQMHPGESFPEHFARNQIGAGLKGLEIVNDINGRIGSFRKWNSENPDVEGDEPEYEYTTAQGKKFKSSQNQPYYDFGDGKPRVLGNFKGDPNAIEYLPPGTPKTTGVLEDANGNLLRYKRFIDTTDGASIPDTAFQPGGNKLVHYGFPDGTIMQYADGTQGPGAGDLHSRQISKPGTFRIGTEGLGFDLPMGVRDPRAPWDDTSGKSFGEEGYDITQSAANEIVPWAADLMLGSAPYMVPTYNIAAGVSAGMPYAMGLDGNSYEPTGRNFENLGKLGMGAYSDKKLTNAQRIGGALSPVVDAYMERAGGKAIGGLGKSAIANTLGRIAPKALPAIEKFTANTFLGQVLESAVGEGIEEAVVSPFDQLSQDSLKNLGRKSYWNPVTNTPVYDPNSKWGDEFWKNVAVATASGSAMGAGMQGALSGKNKAKQGFDKLTGGRFVPGPPMPVAPRKSELQELRPAAIEPVPGS